MLQNQLWSDNWLDLLRLKAMTEIAAARAVVLLSSFVFGVDCTSNVTVLMADAESTQVSLIEDFRKDGSLDWLDTWKPPGRLQEWFPFHKLGPDYDGAPVFLCPYGQWNFRKLFFEGTKEEKSAMETYVKFSMGQFIRDSSKSEYGSGVMIYDYDGFNMASYAHPEALRLTLTIFRELAESQKSLIYGFVINTNFAANAFLDIVKPFLGTYLEKFEIYGTKKARWLPRVLAKIPPESLPTQYGGSKIQDL